MSLYASKGDEVVCPGCGQVHLIVTRDIIRQDHIRADDFVFPNGSAPNVHEEIQRTCACGGQLVRPGFGWKGYSFHFADGWR